VAIAARPEDFADTFGAEIEAAEKRAREESARLIAALARVVSDVGLAEDLAQDALVEALEQWPESGVPDNPGAWLMTVARRRCVDTIRRAATLRNKVELLGRELSDHETPMDEIEFDSHVEDDVLRLMFTACHPVLSVDARVALTLKMVAGLSTEEIARAFLVKTPTMAASDHPGEEGAHRRQRALRGSGQGRTRRPAELGARGRLPGLQRGLYRHRRRAMGAPRAVPRSDAPRPHAGRLGTWRVRGACLGRGSGGEIVTLDRQDRARWDRLLIAHGLTALDRAEELGGTGSYAVQAKIAACHASAPRGEDTDWGRIAALYGDLVALTRSPIAELNRAVAVSRADGPAAGLAVTDGLLDVAALRNYHLLPSVRGDLLAKLGRSREARAEFERAAALTANEAERVHLLARAGGF
jgi:RNA polymerase sigma factor (sigma-70 family)